MGFVWPIRWTLPIAWSSLPGLSIGSMRRTWVASVKLRPLAPDCTGMSSTETAGSRLNLFNWTCELLLENSEQWAIPFSSRARPTINNTSTHWKRFEIQNKIDYNFPLSIYRWKDETFGFGILFFDHQKALDDSLNFSWMRTFNFDRFRIALRLFCLCVDVSDFWQRCAFTTNCTPQTLHPVNKIGI